MATNGDLKRWYGNIPSPISNDFVRVNTNGKIDASLIPAASPESLAEKIEGDDFITVDLNETDDKIQVSLDADYKPFIIELTGSSGTVTDAQFAQLTTSALAQIICDDERYYKADEPDHDGFIVFTHHGRDNQQQIYSKAIYVYTDAESEITYKTWTKISSVVLTNVTDSPVESSDLGKILGCGSSGPMWQLNRPDTVTISTTAPTSANIFGLKFAVLADVPATKYNGWLYIITGSTKMIALGETIIYQST